MTRTPRTSRDEILRLLDKGFTRGEIAKIFDITEQGVWWHLRQSAGKPYETPQMRRRKMMPWDISGPQVKTNPYRQLLLHLEYRDTRGEGMSAEKLRKLRTLYDRLDSFRTVVRYDPEISTDQEQHHGGFEYVEREESDEDLILRVDDNTYIPEENRDLWRLPAMEDWPE